MHVGTMLAAIGGLHLGVGGWLYRGPLAEIAHSGVLATVPDFGDRAASFWFLITGLCLLVFGLTLRDVERRGERLPAVLPAGLALLTVAFVLPMPATGGWLLAPLAWVAHRRRRLSAAASRGCSGA